MLPVTGEYKGATGQCWCSRAPHYPYKYKYRNTYINMNMRPQHITITSIKYLISYPINMKVSNQVFTTSNSNKCVGGLCFARAHLLTYLYKQASSVSSIRVSVRGQGSCLCMGVRARHTPQH